MDKEEEPHPLLQDLHRPLQPCTNKCYCKKCCYHCELCFLQKGLGVRYHVSRKRRKTSTQDNQDPIRQQSISTVQRNGQTTEEGKTEVEKAAAAN
ncbi:tat protein [Simian immunodeficiency virus]|uniref:Protein Tat n=1 Tax=Simian immunodeficiency virus agm.grivet (isolate AGM gr-1) TaxID=31684 RepID=TAT_SIVG1|nr:RecName: Full=Protein Tat; AltName: Full=Transactivating regulatory protein [Simian immunodeficiency virus (isolate AGM / clone GRI-1)]AAA91926.3 tat protein [Simian immunodeficiency virus]